jgi:hypothetical protein
MYEVLIRNGFFLPTFKSNALTEAYMQGIIDGKIFCPKDADIRLKNAYSLPTKKALFGKLIAIAKSNKWALGLNENTNPNKQWIV